MRERSLLVASVVVLCGCAALRYPRVGGRFVTDGKEFGVHEAAASCTVHDRGEGGVVLTFSIDTGARYRSSAEVHVSPDSATRGVDVRFPWSHVVFRPADCSVFETHLEPTVEADDVPRGNSGWLRLQCHVPQGDDSLAADVSFRGC
jgi:hypothetical protein